MNANWIILLAGLTVGALPAYWITSTYYNSVISAEHEQQQQLVITQQEQNRQDLLAYANRIIKSEAEHDKNVATISNLNKQLGRVRVTFPRCTTLPGVTEAGTDSNGTVRVLSDETDRLFARLQERLGSLAERCDTLNADAIRANQLQE